LIGPPDLRIIGETSPPVNALEISVTNFRFCANSGASVQKSVPVCDGSVPAPLYNASMDVIAATFIVRLDRSGSRPWTGVVERVRTGEKRRVEDIEALGRLIAQMVVEEEAAGKV
jgi:hypothetical protein